MQMQINHRERENSAQLSVVNSLPHMSESRLYGSGNGVYTLQTVQTQGVVPALGSGYTLTLHSGKHCGTNVVQ